MTYTSQESRIYNNGRLAERKRLRRAVKKLISRMKPLEEGQSLFIYEDEFAEFLRKMGVDK